MTGIHLLIVSSLGLVGKLLRESVSAANICIAEWDVNTQAAIMNCNLKANLFILHHEMQMCINKEECVQWSNTLEMGKKKKRKKKARQRCEWE